MADHETKELLRCCANNLMKAVNQLESQSNDSGNNASPNSGNNAQPSTSQTPQPATNVQSLSAASEHPNLFGFRVPITSRGGTSYPAPKRHTVISSTGKRMSFPIRNTWTKIFFCLRKTNSTTVPTASEKASMALCGMQEKSICFNKDGSSDHVHDQIINAFPCLKDSGGYEILRTGDKGNKNLMVLEIPPGGYTVEYLDYFGCCQRLLRPLQKDIVMNIVTVGQTQNHSSPKVQCINCNLNIPMNMMRQHQDTCGGGGSGMSSSSSATVINSSPSASQDPTDSHSIVVKKVLQEDIAKLQTMFPDAHQDHLKKALKDALGDVNLAVEELLQIEKGDDSDELSDTDLMESVFGIKEGSRIQYTLEDVMSKHKKGFDLSGVERISVLREWQESVAIFKSLKFKTTSPPFVTFEGESGVDAGGLRNEYGTLLREKIFSAEANLFEGKAERKLPMYSMEAIQSRLFQLAGKMVAYIIMHLDIGIPCLSPCVYQYIACTSLENASSYCSIDDLCDLEIKDLTEKVNTASSENELQELKKDGVLMDNLVSAGWLKDLTMQNKSLAMQTLLVHFTLQKRKEPLDQFIKGLDTLGISALIKSHPELMKKYFVSSESKLTSQNLIGLLSARPSDESEEKAYCYLIESIKKLEEDHGSTGLESFLHYATGLTSIPPLGLEKKIEVEFVRYSSSLFAETCTLVLQVPTTHESCQEFMEKVKEACDNHKGFGSA